MSEYTTSSSSSGSTTPSVYQDLETKFLEVETDRKLLRNKSADFKRNVATANIIGDTKRSKTPETPVPGDLDVEHLALRKQHDEVLWKLNKLQREARKELRKHAEGEDEDTRAQLDRLKGQIHESESETMQNRMDLGRCSD